jgi:hypothetical protein
MFARARCASKGGGRPAAEVLGFIVMLLHLRKMSIDVIEVFATAFLRMVSDQNGLTQRDSHKRRTDGRSAIKYAWQTCHELFPEAFGFNIFFII